MLKLPKAKISNRVLRTKLAREISIWVFMMPAAFAVIWFWLPSGTVQAAVTQGNGSGTMFYGDVTNAGQLKSRIANSSGGYDAEVSSLSTSASNIMFVDAKSAPSREEYMIGFLKVDGRLDIATCTTQCDASGDFTNRWNHNSVSATQDCDTAPTLDTCMQPFDIAYESLNGKAMVVYAGDGADGGTVTDTDTLYYAEWDGSAWAPNTTPGTPGTSNDIDIGESGITAGTPQWVRLIPEGENLGIYRSNRLMLLVSDSNEDLFASYWDGSTWSTSERLETDLEGASEGRPFDGGWYRNETANGAARSNFVAIYSELEGTPVDDYEYRTYTVGTGWSGQAQAFSQAGLSASVYVTATSDPSSSRVLVATANDGGDAESAVWRGDNATDGWTECAAGGCPDTGTENTGGQQATPGFYRAAGGSNGFVAWNDSAASDYWTYTAPSTWGGPTANGMTEADDALSIKTWTTPNIGGRMMFAMVDLDCDLDTVDYNGTFNTHLDIETSSSVHNNSSSCAVNATPSDGESSMPYDFTYKLYNGWQRNWQFFAGTDTTSIPDDANALAAEDTTPTGFDRAAGIFRLRANYVTRNKASSSTDDRKKLQYTFNCNPNSVTDAGFCSWTDVDAAGGGGIWRYKDLTCTATDCADNTLLTGIKLSDTDASCSLGVGCGTWVLQASGGTVTNMDHNASTSSDVIQESEWIVEANNAYVGKTYYFRIYNVGQDTPYYTEQDANDCNGGSAQCTYPSITVDGGGVADVMRHGNSFRGGTEQGFSWTD